MIPSSTGHSTDWRRVIRAVDEDLWGVVAGEVETALNIELPAAWRCHSTTRWPRRGLGRARPSERSSRPRFARSSSARGGPFARRINTSASRCSTGKVVPSVALLVRVRNLASGRRARRRGYVAGGVAERPPARPLWVLGRAQDSGRDREWLNIAYVSATWEFAIYRAFSWEKFASTLRQFMKSGHSGTGLIV